MQDILNGYAAAATPQFVAEYDALETERIYEHVIDLFPASPASVVDIGAGTGRDAAWFAKRGHHVLAVEPVEELREAGRKLHKSNDIKWLDDRLPELKAVQSCGRFDLVTLCAVWQHLDNAHRAIAFPNLASITKFGGTLIMSLRHGPGAVGRQVFAVSPDDTIRDARNCGYELVRQIEADSVQGTNKAMGVTWTWLAFKRAGCPKFDSKLSYATTATRSCHPTRP